MPTTTRAKPPASPRTRYEDDLYTWVEEQVALLRAGKLSEIDAANIAEELGDLAKAELRSLKSAIAVLTQHLLKWDHQSKRRSRSWELTVREHRRQIVEVLQENPGLRAKLATAIVSGYASGRNGALGETGLPDEAMPEACPYTFDEMMTRPITYVPPPRHSKKG